MTTQQIADRLVELCKAGKFEDAQKELYDDNALSIEPLPMPGMDKETKGLQAIINKGHHFMSMVEETHGIRVSDPVVAPHSFCINLVMDITMKGRDRMDMSELCVYDIKDGKIVTESFHY